MLTPLPGLKQTVETAQAIAAASAEWIQTATLIHGQTESAERIRTACNSIIVRARKLSMESSLEFRVTRQWMIHKQKPLRNCINDLPEDLKALGIMKMVEDSDEVRSIMGRPN